MLYRNYSQYLQEKYDEKVYKIPVNLPGTCPNRDGTVGVGGCIFCDEKGSGFECLSNTLTVQNQLKKNKEFYNKRFGVKKFIAYFQAFTNTYLPYDKFCENILAVTEDKELVGIAISTRPDCIDEKYLLFLKDIEKNKNLDITIELGLQTVNYHTLDKINRGHTLAEFIDAVLRIKKYNFGICTHLILNLPWDGEKDVIENAKILSALDVDFVKLHSLYIVKGTPLGKMYENGKINLIGINEYINRVIIFLEYLSPHIVIQRIVGKGVKDDMLFCNWNTSWWKIKDTIEEKMIKDGTCQGKKCYYLNGRIIHNLNKETMS
ncbi:MAG: TIGR01212 family radical SAM protein [Clostridia bacterium]|nr:TIGR01212 family radical SAM protein [Clostridia bacterium]MDD4048228.1 TIGR01212 family radical SAM protein [Clostridia bacterium]